MADQTKIEWTDSTWTPVKGCTRASEGCRNCYAEVMAARFNGPGQWGEGLAEIVTTPQGKDHRWTGQVRFDERELTKPLAWKKPRRVFVCSTADLFHESVPDEWIDKVFAVMALCPQHTFQVLTKRAGRMRDYLTDERLPGVIGRAVLDMAIAVPSLFKRDSWPVRSVGDIDFPSDVVSDLPLPNVWLGVSAEDQARADERIPDLLATPAAVRFLSCEPLLGPVDLAAIKHPLVRGACVDGLRGHEWSPPDRKFGISVPMESANWTPDAGPSRLHWIIAGGESGPGARPMHPDWVRSLRDQCQAAGVPFFFKQWGEWLPIKNRNLHGFNGWAMIDHLPEQDGSFRVGKARAGRLLDGREWSEFPG